VGGGPRSPGPSAPGRFAGSEQTTTQLARAGSHRRAATQTPATAPAAKIRSGCNASFDRASSTKTMAAPRVVQRLAQRPAAPRTVIVGTPSRVAMRSRALSSTLGWTPTSRPAHCNRRPCVRRRRASPARADRRPALPACRVHRSAHDRRLPRRLARLRLSQQRPCHAGRDNRLAPMGNVPRRV
jgi:hypothetical protein